ncbi:hypothetical protein OIU77_008046 [Salix suchowensis]|uniref:Uncharacterized protein n=1 Tax=Salix suchowensis TaxID=1278906 RepID=A0ABQ9AI63_9ROSI|nr:hypothetical protein OIU77_008046 [Salix suchowensis]
MCSETSPRISFSNDLGQENDREQVSRRDTALLDSNPDFEFRICSHLFCESSPADELFADGMILPVQIQERITVSKQIHRHESPRKSFTSSSSMSFYFSRKRLSPSLSGDSREVVVSIVISREAYAPLPLLSRSNSTGSEPNAKRKTLKDTHKSNNSQKQQSTAMAKSPPSSTSSVSSFVYSSPQKPPLKKSGSYGKISPVLKVPPPYIYTGTANLFGLGSFLRNGKEKKVRK